MTVSSIKPLDWMPKPARSLIMDFVGYTEDHALKVTCRTFALTPSSEVNPDLLSTDKVVERIVSSDSEEDTGWSGLFDKSEFSDFDKEKYIKGEELLRAQKKDRTFSQNWDCYEAVGGLRASMNPQEINAFVQSKFEDLRKSGILLYGSEFEVRETRTQFRKPADQDLTRLWGAEYLREKFTHTNKAKGKYKVPRFVLVIDDSIRVLTILLSRGQNALSISSIRTRGAQLLVENISQSAHDGANSSHQWMNSIGYVDYSSGNILKRRDGYYVVDTEWRSFQRTFEDETEEVRELRRYTEKRFDAFNQWDSKLINIKLY